MDDVVGDLVFDTTINSGQFDAGLAKLENNAKKAANNVDKAAQKVATLRQQLEELQAVAENEKKTRSTGTVSQETGEAIQKTTQQLKMAQLNLESSQIAQEKASAAVSEYVGKQRLAALTTQNVSEQFKKFTKRIAGLAKRVFIFTMITKALRTMRKMLLSTIGADKQMSTSLAQIRGNLISAFAPIYNYILPAVRTLLAWLAKLTAVVSVFINSLFGKTASQADASAKALYNQASATEAAGDAAEKAKKQLSGLDEMNRWESNDSSGGGGGGGSSGIAPKFDLSDQVDTGKIGKIAAVVRELSPYVAAVAAGFAAWKIGKKFLGNLSKAKQLALAVAGAVLMAINVVDMLKNGINFDNLTGYIIGAAAAVTGLGLAFGVLGGAITAIVAGLVLLGVSIRDVIKNGFNSKNLTAITVALLTIGGAIAIITGAWIPLLIAAIAAVVVWIVAKWTAIKDWISKTISSIDAAFEQHLANVEAGVAVAVDWVIEKWTAVKDWFRGLWEKVASGASSAWEGIKNAFKSVPEWFQSKFRDAWQKVKDVFSTGGRIWSGIKEGIESTFRTVVNAIIRGMNTIIAVPFNRINSMLNTIRNAHFLGISPFQNLWGVNPLPVPQIPMLARGAVIPANRQFLAVLGDQRNGNNLEAPESLLRQIVREEAGGAGSRYEFIARLDRRTLFDEVITEAKLRKGQTGKNPLVAV
nr:MAG TPA: minor tail protein [Caudoviricetes sp.]